MSMLNKCRASGCERDSYSEPQPETTFSPATSRGCGWMARAGKEVSITQIVSDSGSAQANVPVDPVWPNVRSEQPLLPAVRPTLKPSPRG